MSPLERKIWKEYGPKPTPKPRLRIVKTPAEIEAEWLKHLSKTQIRRRWLLERARDRFIQGRDFRRFIPTMGNGGQIIIEVAQAHRLDPSDLRGPARHKTISRARQEAVYRMAQETTLSYPMMGRLLGNRDHTTIMHAIRAYGRRLGVTTLPRGMSWGRRADLQCGAESSF